jgi:hypothetical protein
LKNTKVTLQRRVMIQNLSNLTKMLPLRSLTMQGAVSIEITEIIWICNVFFKVNYLKFSLKFVNYYFITNFFCIFVRLDKFWIITLLCKVTLVFFSGYHDIPWAFQTLLKLEKKFYSRHHELANLTKKLPYNARCCANRNN